MKSILKRNRVLAVIALIGLLASLVPLISRVQAEESNKYYDIVLDYNSMRSMARQSSQSEDEWIDLFKSLGVDKVALSEASALNLHDNAAIPVHAMTVKKAAESEDGKSGEKTATDGKISTPPRSRNGCVRAPM